MLVRYLLLTLTIHGSRQSSEKTKPNLTISSSDHLPWIPLSELQAAPFSLRVIILTMNRPESLTRLLNSLTNTFFEEPTDTLHVEIHVDKAHGNCMFRTLFLRSSLLPANYTFSSTFCY
jgi:hypothetical protein